MDLYHFTCYSKHMARMTRHEWLLAFESTIARTSFWSFSARFFVLSYFGQSIFNRSLFHGTICHVASLSMSFGLSLFLDLFWGFCFSYMRNLNRLRQLCCGIKIFFDEKRTQIKNTLVEIVSKHLKRFSCSIRFFK